MSGELAISPELGCTQAYTWDKVYQGIKLLYKTKRSLRRVANEDYFGEINHAVVQRCLAGIEPKNSEIRLVLGLSTTIGISPTPGSHITPGATSLGSIVCPDDRGKDCGNQAFISNHWKRERCYTCSPPPRAINLTAKSV